MSIDSWMEGVRTGRRQDDRMGGSQGQTIGWLDDKMVGSQDIGMWGYLYPKMVGLPEGKDRIKKLISYL